jgi:hypothetical protein
MNENERRPGETFPQYRERMRRLTAHGKRTFARLLWDSSAKGTYVRKKHGALM